MFQKVAAIMILASAPLYANNWTKQAEWLRGCLVQITYIHIDEDGNKHTGSCTGIVINHTKGFILTVPHCLPTAEDADTLLVYDKIRAPQPALIVEADDAVVVLAVANLTGKLNLKTFDGKVRMGEPILAAGYGYALGDYLVVAGIVSHPYLSPYEDIHSGVLSGFPFAPGMSGGAVVNEDGKLIGLVQASSEDGLLGYAVALPAIHHLADKYFADYHH